MRSFTLRPATAALLITSLFVVGFAVAQQTAPSTQGSAAPAAKAPAFLTPELRDAWRERYGSNWVELVDLALAKPELQKPVLARFQFTRADLVYMVTVELAHTLEDVILRRTKMIYSLTKTERARLSRELRKTLEASSNLPRYSEEGA